MFDVAAASTFLIILSPLILLITLLVKTTSRGPVLFHQTRVGLHGRNFTMFKFRSMRINNDPAIHQHYVADWILGATGSTEPEDIERGLDTNGSKRYKITSDPRITRIGRVIRATSLDELPQLLNVIRGDMSLVGPRPPLPYEVERYTTWHRRRLDVLPGITGLWQVSGRNRLSFEEMIQLDVEYIEEWALTTDLKIVWKTLPALFMNKGY
jgi:lipopolysaccharide/colanic/teichoic acid biosynthesis glycosyltransferase